MAYDEVTSTNDRISNPKGMMNRPTEITLRGSYRADSDAPRGDSTIITSANGNVNTPAFSGV